MKLLKYKRGQEGSTLTWVVATFLLVFLLAIYFLFLGFTYLKNNVGDYTLAASYQDSSYLLAKKLIVFMESPIDAQTKMIDLLLKDGMADKSDRVKIFEKKAAEFLDNNYPKYDSVDFAVYLLNSNGLDFNVKSDYSIKTIVQNPLEDTIHIEIPLSGDKELKFAVFPLS